MRHPDVREEEVGAKKNTLINFFIAKAICSNVLGPYHFLICHPCISNVQIQKCKSQFLAKHSNTPSFVI